MRECNHCKLQAIRKQAKKDGRRVSLRPAAWGMGGSEVYVHPRTVKTPWADDREKYWVAWMMLVPERCEC